MDQSKTTCGCTESIQAGVLELLFYFWLAGFVGISSD
jgi:hypothetical protein